MKTNFHIYLLILAASVFNTCSSAGEVRGTSPAVGGTEISARGTLGGRLETAPVGPLYTGDGGRNIRLAILAPQVQGEVPGYLPLYVQGLLNNNFGKYSTINLIDRQNLDRIISEQNLATNGRFSDNDFVRIGNLTNAQYFLFGTIQKLSGDRYSLQLSITDSSTGVIKATFMKDGSLSQFEGRGTLINEATAELLSHVGIQLTEAGLRTLLAGNTSTVLAEAGLARGITAQAGGSEVEALFNYTQAITFNPSQIEALSRLNMLSATISGGTISQRIVNDIQARDRWIEVFKETVRFFNAHPPFEIIFDPNLIQIGETDYARRTANIGMGITLNPSEAGFNALNALLEGLEKTGRRGTWGFYSWPLMEINPKTAGTVVFGGKRFSSFKVDVALVNEANKTIGNSSVTLTTEMIDFSNDYKIVIAPGNVDRTMRFLNIKIEDLTPTLNIVIVAVNGISSRELNASGYMKIETGELGYHAGAVLSVAFSPDGRQIVSGSYDNTIKLWDVASGRVIRTFSGHTEIVYSVAFSPDSRQIVSSSRDKTIRLWDVTSGRAIRTFSGHTDSVHSVAFSPDGRQIVSGSYDNTIKLWDAASGRVIRTFSENKKYLHSVAFSPDGRYILSSGSDGDAVGDTYGDFIKLWDVTSGRVIRTFSGNGTKGDSVVFSPDGRQIVSGNYHIDLWDVATGRNIKKFNLPAGVLLVYSIAFSSDGKQIVIISGRSIVLLDAATGREIKTFSGHTGRVHSVAFSPDGRQIVSGLSDNTIKLWDVSSGRVIRTFSGSFSDLNSLAFSPNGRQIISGSLDSTIMLWDATTGRQIGMIGSGR